MQSQIPFLPGWLPPAIWLCVLVNCLLAQQVRLRASERPGKDDHAPNFKVSTSFGDFPSLPPDPYELDKAPLDPLAEELWFHGGSYLYQPEGDRLHWIDQDQADHDQRLRLPESWQAPKPLTMFSDFLGADPIFAGRQRRIGGYSLEPRFVAYGGYELFGLALEQADRRQDVIGHNLRIDLDLRLTGTERFHLQFRPLGERNSGGSFYQFGMDEGYVDNSTAEPDRYWFEGEMHSFIGFPNDVFARQYINFMAGKFPFTLHNALLVNDEILGAIVSQNNIQLSSLSNLNLQWFVGANDVDTYPDNETRIYGLHAAADFGQTFFEATYAYADAQAGRSTHFLALSRTQFSGPLTVALRGLVKLGDQAGSGGGHLLTAESNFIRVFDREPFGFHQAVFFCNAFWAEAGWNSIAGTNFNRLRTAFEVDPLTRLATLPTQEDTFGVSLGAQLFRHHEDESCVPEFAWEDRGGDAVLGFGLRYLRKTGPRTFIEVLGVINWSGNNNFDREGISLAHTTLF